LNTSLLSKDNFTDLLSHELAETISDPDSAGIRVSPPSPFSGSGQIGDFEPDGARYVFRLNDPNNDLVQAYWSQQDQAFIIPDGNVQKFNLVPIWNGTTFSGKFNLNLNGDQGDNIVIGGGTVVSVTMNNESVTFPFQTIQTVNVNTGGGSNQVQVLSIPFGVTVNLDSYVLGSNDSVVVGNGSLAGISGQLNISNHSGQSSLFINASQDGTQYFDIESNAIYTSDLLQPINYQSGYLDPAGNPHGVTSLTLDEGAGSFMWIDTIGAIMNVSVYWEIGIYGTPWSAGLLQGPSAGSVRVIYPFFAPLF
jgi:hypothetical protein